MTRRTRHRRSATLGSCLCLGAWVALTWAAPRRAAACGGTFCDNGQPQPMPQPMPQSMPVDQTGETILFVLDGDRVEAHIQIQYDPETEAEKFAWLVPLPAVPEFSVGSQQLFSTLLEATVPSVRTSTYIEPCTPPNPGNGGGWGGGTCTGATGGSGITTGAGDGDGSDGWGQRFDVAADAGSGPDVVKHETVGAFEIVVLDGGTAEEIMQWLGDNGFAQDSNAEPILEEYLEEGHVFAAFKLVHGADTSEIHPIVVNYPGDEPCVPIRLTRIAAVDDMNIRALFLGSFRTVPTNYKHVVINPLKLDFFRLGVNYPEVVSLAVDEPMAAGHAFVTEFAGATPSVGTLTDPAWNAEVFRTIAPVDVIDELVRQRLMGCAPGEIGQCNYAHPLIEGLVRRWLPAPATVPEVEFYACLSCYEGLIDGKAWDGQAFADAMHDRVIDPAIHGDQLLDTWPYLTRLFTTMSPHEMTVDPTFHENSDLPIEGVVGWSGTRNQWCAGNQDFALRDMRSIDLPDPASWPDIAPADMPWAETIEQMPPAGPPIVIVDNSMWIDELLRQWNAQWVTRDPPVARICGDDDMGTDLGCACTSDSDPPLWSLGLLTVFAVRRRRY